MSKTGIPLKQVFRSRSISKLVPPDPTSDAGALIKEKQQHNLAQSSSVLTHVVNASTAENDLVHLQPPQPQLRSAAKTEQRVESTTDHRVHIVAAVSAFKMASNNNERGTRTPKMLEYERQAEQRLLEAQRIEAERDRIQQDQAAMRREQERISQEEYEMEQYYEAEALKHAEELRLHQEEVKRHQERKREHDRKMRDHEASSEAFAKVIAMPARPARERQVSLLNMGANGQPQGGGRPGPG